MTLPHTLHGQLFLLGFDGRKGRLDLDNHWLFGLALRAAMLTDLYLDGYLDDAGDGPCPTGAAPPADSLLASILDEAVHARCRDWARTILRGHRNTAHEVLGQLVSSGWLRPRRQRVLGVIPVTQFTVPGENLVVELGATVTAALHAAIGGRPTDERLLTLGLLAVTVQLPGVLGAEEVSRRHDTLTSLIEHAAPPVRGMVPAIQEMQWEITRLQNEAASHRT